MSDEISEADWERAASKKNSVSLARDFGDERLYVPKVSPLHVTREEALAAQAELDAADEITYEDAALIEALRTEIIFSGRAKDWASATMLATNEVLAARKARRA